MEHGVLEYLNSNHTVDEIMYADWNVLFIYFDERSELCRPVYSYIFTLKPCFFLDVSICKYIIIIIINNHNTLLYRLPFLNITTTMYVNL